MKRIQQPRGNVLLLAIILLPALAALISLGVDYGRVQLAKSELQAAADAAARHAASGLVGNSALAKAINSANDNFAAGLAVTLTSQDVETGNWDASLSPQFSTSRTPVNAVRVTARRVASRNTAIPLTFGQLIGVPTCDLTAVAIARGPVSNTPDGFVGLNGMDFKNNSFIGSYNSNSTTTPTSGTSTGRGALASNGSISFKNNSTINGNVKLGPSSPGIDGKNKVVITGATTVEGSAFTAPSDPAWSPAGNPGGIPQNYTVGSNTTLPGGTYWFTSLTVNKKLTFSGPATLYVNGNIYTDDSIVTHGSKPANLTIYQLGANRTFDVQKDLTLIANVQASGSDLIGNNKLYLYGKGVYKSIVAKNSAEFFADEAGASGGGSGGIVLVD